MQAQPAVQPAAGAAGLQQALIQHDRVRRTTDIPLFYGKREKDTITPQQLVSAWKKLHVLLNGITCLIQMREKRMSFTYR
jgi:hypothetical protein